MKKDAVLAPETAPPFVRGYRPDGAYRDPVRQGYPWGDKKSVWLALLVSARRLKGVTIFVRSLFMGQRS